jgi:CheY-like chemotaxis protein
VILDSPSLLISDDDRALRETLGELFEVRGYRTLLAADGVEAVEIVRADVVHLVLLDQNMPRLKGLEVLGQLRQLESSPPCILMSGEVDDTLQRAASMSNVFSVLAKPLRPAVIADAVAAAMRVRYDWPPLN